MAEEEITQKKILEYQKTVAELCRKVAEDPKRYTAYVMQDELPCLIPIDGVFAVVDAAYMREIAAKDAEIKQLRIKLSRVMDVTGDCRKCQDEGDESCPWYGEPDGCNNREACAKFFDGKLVDPIKVKDAEIASLRALVKELADALKKIDDACDGDMCKYFIDTEQCSNCKYLETCETGIAHNALKTNESEIAKALEVCK